MAIIETEVWKKNPDRPGTLIFDKQRAAQDIFDDLKAHLTADGRMPDEYFLFDAHGNWKDGALFPKDADILCDVNFGGSEGIYLDISVKYKKQVYEYNEESKGFGWHNRTVIEHFATGKTLGDSIEDLDRMSLVSSSVTTAFYGGQREVKERYAQIERGERQAVYPIPKDETGITKEDASVTDAPAFSEADNTAETIFGAVQPGDWVISAGGNDYRYLLGTVTAIDKHGSPEHGTDNETDDVHVDFTAFDYPPERIAEIEEHFALLTGKLKNFSNLPLDDVIMAPKTLIRISHLEQDEITRMGNDRHNCEAFCDCFPGGIEPKSERHAKLIARVEQNYADYMDSLMDFGKAELIDMAGKIQAVSDARACLSASYDFSEDEVDFYLKFTNPLEVVADAWYERISDDSDMSLALYEIYDKWDALVDYPLMSAAGQIEEDVSNPQNITELIQGDYVSKLRDFLDFADKENLTGLAGELRQSIKETEPKKQSEPAPKAKTLAEKLQAAKDKAKEQDAQGGGAKSRKREERE